MLVDGRTGGLDDEDIRAPDVLVDLKRDLAVRETTKTRLPDGDAEEIRDLGDWLSRRLST